MKPSVAIRACILLCLAAAGCNSFSYAPDFCERNDQCPSGLCDRARLRCTPPAAGTSEERDATFGGEGGGGSPGDVDIAGDATDGLIGTDDGGASVRPNPGMAGNDGGQPEPPAPCAADGECPTGAPLCLAGRCAKCAAAADCLGRPGGPACETVSGRCAECATGMDCQEPGKAFCIGNLCVGCQVAGASVCTGAAPVCDAGSGKCVECTDSGTHCRTPAAFCLMNRCLGCQMAPAGSCLGATPVCDPASGRCVECTEAVSCKTEEKAFCHANVCVGCQAAGNGACGGATPACDGGSGRCVECVSSSDCGLQEPVCNPDTKTCGPCTNDSQCVLKPGGPGICMFHQPNGRCASDAETLYVSSARGCGAGSGAGTASIPFCTPQAAIGALTGSLRLLVIRGPLPVPGFSSTSGGDPLSVIGQNDAVITGMNQAGITLASRDLYLRNLSVSGGNQIGIVARSGATLRLEQVKVKDNRNVMPVAGGIFIDGAAFDIRNCLISGNGPGVDDLGAFWGGLRVKAASDSLKRLSRVSVVDNQNTGVSCAEEIDGMGVFARNPGQGDLTPSCDVTPCPTLSASCGSDLQP